MEPHRKGDFTEAAVLTELKERSIAVSFPFGDNERYDAIAESPDGGLYRLQIKTGRASDGTVTFDAVSSHTNSEGHVYEPYGEETDLFAVYCHEHEQLYLLPQESVGTSKTLRVDAGAEPDRRTTPAERYHFDRVWPPDGSGGINISGNGDDTAERARIGVIERFEALGADVYTSNTEGSGREFVAATPAGNILRITVRTATESEGRIRVGRDEGPPRGDYCAVHCHSNDQVYLISGEEIQSIDSLRTTAPQQVQSNTTWASKYRLEQVWPPAATPSAAPESSVGAAMASFEAAGVPVALVGDVSTPYDLLVGGDTGFRRVAVVACHASRGCLRLKPDSKREIDAFVLYHRDENDCYAVDSSAFDRSISLRVREPERVDSTVNWAENYRLPEQWPP
jgi:hypothetical protein